jgi:hypothetical protein
VSPSHASFLDRGSISCSFFHGGIGTPLALIGEIAEHSGQCLCPVIMGASGGGVRNLEFMVVCAKLAG